MRIVSLEWCTSSQTICIILIKSHNNTLNILQLFIRASANTLLYIISIPA